jgi:hypothetical protein
LVVKIVTKPRGSYDREYVDTVDVTGKGPRDKS